MSQEARSWARGFVAGELLGEADCSANWCGGATQPELWPGYQTTRFDVAAHSWGGRHEIQVPAVTLHEGHAGPLEIEHRVIVEGRVYSLHTYLRRTGGLIRGSLTGRREPDDPLDPAGAPLEARVEVREAKAPPPPSDDRPLRFLRPRLATHTASSSSASTWPPRQAQPDSLSEEVEQEEEWQEAKAPPPPCGEPLRLFCPLTEMQKLQLRGPSTWPPRQAQPDSSSEEAEHEDAEPTEKWRGEGCSEGGMGSAEIATPVNAVTKSKTKKSFWKKFKAFKRTLK